MSDENVVTGGPVSYEQIAAGRRGSAERREGSC